MCCCVVAPLPTSDICWPNGAMTPPHMHFQFNVNIWIKRFKAQKHGGEFKSGESPLFSHRVIVMALKTSLTDMRLVLRAGLESYNSYLTSMRDFASLRYRKYYPENKQDREELCLCLPLPPSLSISLCTSQLISIGTDKR